MNYCLKKSQKQKIVYLLTNESAIVIPGERRTRVVTVAKVVMLLGSSYFVIKIIATKKVHYFLKINNFLLINDNQIDTKLRNTKNPLTTYLNKTKSA